MYQFSYTEVVEDSPRQHRDREREAIARSIELMQAAQTEGMQSRAAVDAMVHTRRLWSILIEDLAKPENDLPSQLRADLISIGLWVLRELEEIRDGRQASFKSLIDISTTISEGLK